MMKLEDWVLLMTKQCALSKLCFDNNKGLFILKGDVSGDTWLRFPTVGDLHIEQI
jgi:hypothetical protein